MLIQNGIVKKFGVGELDWVFANLKPDTLGTGIKSMKTKNSSNTKRFYSLNNSTYLYSNHNYFDKEKRGYCRIFK